MTRLDVDRYVHGILQGDRVILAKAITLVESSLPHDQQLAGIVINRILDRTGNSIRIGITGVPGVGKSTFIEAFGNHIIREGKKIAVLTVDPSSEITRGSILGDKTRMETLSRNPMAFIRPTPSHSVLGGVAGKTREVILLCEAAGFEVIIVETVGVGQSETAVRNIVDFFLLLMIAGAGDELQGIKKGIMEMADGIVITKADNDNVERAAQAEADIRQALRLIPQIRPGWSPRVLTSSALQNKGIRETWSMIQDYKMKVSGSGYFQQNRRQQNIAWFNDRFQELLLSDYQRFDSLRNEMQKLQEKVGRAELSPLQAAQRLLEAYHQALCNSTS